MDEFAVAIIAFIGALAGAMAPALLTRRDRRLHARQAWVAEVLEEHRQKEGDAYWDDVNDPDIRWSYRTPKAQPSPELLAADALRADALYEMWSLTLRTILLLQNIHPGGPLEAARESARFRRRITRWASGAWPTYRARQVAGRLQLRMAERSSQAGVEGF